MQYDCRPTAPNLFRHPLFQVRAQHELRLGGPGGRHDFLWIAEQFDDDIVLAPMQLFPHALGETVESRS
jgi:hypothetical protein